jgi:hypothetical protein
LIEREGERERGPARSRVFIPKKNKNKKNKLDKEAIFFSASCERNFPPFGKNNFLAYDYMNICQERDYQWILAILISLMALEFTPGFLIKFTGIF